MYWQMYELPPYRIYVYDHQPSSGTRIDKIVIDPYGHGEGSWEYKNIFSVDVAITFPLDNLGQVVEKIKLYTTFS